MRVDVGDRAFEARFKSEPWPGIVIGRSRSHEVTHRTTCAVVPDDGEPGVTGVAYCSVKDAYDRNRGEAVALRRALFEADVPHDAWPPFFLALAVRHRGRRLSGAARSVLERARVALLRGEVEPADLELLVGDARGRRP